MFFPTKPEQRKDILGYDKKRMSETWKVAFKLNIVAFCSWKVVKVNYALVANCIGMNDIFE
jgi:hypothetical protein